MARLKGAAATFAAVLLGCATAHAQIGGHPIEISGGAGWSEPDSRSHLRSGLAINAALGYRMNSFFTLEGQGTWIPSENDLLPEGFNRNLSVYGLDGRINLRPAEGRLVPFLLGGFGYAVSHDDGATPAKLERGAPTAGMGLLWNVARPNVYLRFQVRD